jgi:hypothetical protein
LVYFIRIHYKLKGSEGKWRQEDSEEQEQDERGRGRRSRITKIKRRREGGGEAEVAVSTSKLNYVQFRNSERIKTRMVLVTRARTFESY